MKDKVLAQLRIADHFREIMVELGLDVTNPSLKNTPNRVAKMLVTELCAGLHTEPPVMTAFKAEGSQMVVVKSISVTSLCEHHFLPFTGVCHIAYVPNKKILGLSKFPRAVQYFAARPQVQERLTTDVAKFLAKAAGTENIAVVMDCSHSCCSLRGVKDPNPTTLTSYLGGIFFEGNVRQEFMSLIK